MIKHLVISGGGSILIQTLGIIQQLEEQNYIVRNNIESIYGTSAGTLIAILYALNFEWNIVNEYIVGRPWNDLFKITTERIFNSFNTQGIFNYNIIVECFKPLFNAKDIDLNINLIDFYNLNNVEIHFFSLELNNFSIENISYLTHPELPLLRAVQMSCGLPILLEPYYLNNNCYIDGGIMCNYPLNYCIESKKNTNEILGFKNSYKNDNIIINNNFNIFEYIINFVFKIIYSLNTEHKQEKIENEIINIFEKMSIENLNNAFTNIDIRKELLNNGINIANNYLEKKGFNNKDNNT